MKTVFVVGHDWKFRALLRAQLREEGYRALGFSSLAEAAAARAAARPAALVFDTSGASLADAEGQLAAVTAGSALVVVASAQQQVPPAWPHVLRRPLRLEEVVKIVKSLVPPETRPAGRASNSLLD